MAINYEPIGWNTTKYVNPSNMNHMDDGIKAACDGVDAVNENLAKKMSFDVINDADANTMLTAGSYAGVNWKNTPSDYGVLNVGGSGSYITNEFCDMVNHVFYYRSSNDNGATWSEWESHALNSDLATKMDNSYIVAGTNAVGFVNTQYVSNVTVTLGFKPSMVVIQSSDPVISIGLTGMTDDGFTVSSYCFTGVINLVVPFFYQCTR